MAHQYGFIELETAVCDYLKETLCTNNVCIIYDMASLYSLKGLSTVCEDFIDKNAPAVLSHESFMAVSPVICMKTFNIKYCFFLITVEIKF